MGTDTLMLKGEKFYAVKKGSYLIDLFRDLVYATLLSEREQAVEVANNRQKKKRPTDCNRQRLNGDPAHEDTIGALAELVVQRIFGLLMDKASLRAGDAGFDFMWNGLRIEVKAYRMPEHMLLKENVPDYRVADIHLLFGVGYRMEEVVFLGWATKDEIKSAPIRKFNDTLKYANHYIHRTQLRSAKSFVEYFNA